MDLYSSYFVLSKKYTFRFVEQDILNSARDTKLAFFLATLASW